MLLSEKRLWRRELCWWSEVGESKKKIEVIFGHDKFEEKYFENSLKYPSKL